MMAKLGSMTYQAEQITNQIKEIGGNKYEYKHNAVENGAKGSHEINSQIPICGWEKWHDVVAAGARMGDFCKAEFGLKDLRAVTGEMVQAYCEMRAETLSSRSFQTDMSDTQKFGQALGRTSEFHEIIQDARDLNRGDRGPAGAPWRDPQAIISELPERSQIVAQLGEECGLRRADACYVKAEQVDIAKGILTVDNSKGGQTYQVPISNELGQRIIDHGGVSIKPWQYGADLRESAQATDQEGNHHSFRYDYANNRMGKLQDAGLSYRAALLQISNEMGHHRPEITKYYLRG